MTQPTPRTIQVALAALNAESALWTEQSTRLQRVANQADALLIEPGVATLIADDFLAVYNQIARRYTAVCTDGRDAATTISATLAAVSQTYAQEEAANLHAQRHLY